jgi:hypothetical protein
MVMLKTRNPAASRFAMISRFLVITGNANLALNSRDWNANELHDDFSYYTGRHFPGSRGAQPRQRYYVSLYIRTHSASRVPRYNF